MNIFNNIKNQSDEDLMILVRGGNNDAFSIISDRYYKRILNYFFKMLNSNEEKSRDFTHDLFLKIIEKPELFNENKRLKPWIYTIASNMCKNEYRSLKVRQITNNNIDNHTGIIKEENTTGLIDNNDFSIKLKKEINILDEANKNIFILRFYEDLSIKEIATIIDCPEGTVKSRIFYTLKKLSGKLQEFNPLKN